MPISPVTGDHADTGPDSETRPGSALRVRVVYKDGSPAGYWRAREAERTVARGYGKWLPLDEVPSATAWADAGAARLSGCSDVELVLQLGYVPKDARVHARGLRAERARNEARDCVALDLRLRRLGEASDALGMFARAGRPLDDESWEASVQPRVDAYLGRVALRQVAEQAAGGGRLPIRTGSRRGPGGGLQNAGVSQALAAAAGR